MEDGTSWVVEETPPPDEEGRHFLGVSRAVWNNGSDVAGVFCSANLLNVGRQISVNGILAIGITFVLISGGIDLSVGSTVALTGVCAAFFAGEHNGIPLIILFNGIGVVFGRLPPFIMTLAVMISIRGLAEFLCDGRPVFALMMVAER